MLLQNIFVLAVLVLVIYFTLRRWVVAHIFAILVAGTLADPLHVDLRRSILEECNRIEAEMEKAESDTETYKALERRLEERNDFLASLDPSCPLGREALLATAWDIYHECGWRTRKIA